MIGKKGTSWDLKKIQLRIRKKSNVICQIIYNNTIVINIRTYIIKSYIHYFTTGKKHKNVCRVYNRA